ncbi:MAG: hypothetical protein ACRDJN_24890 [Chloroflexota bacterium]
MAISTQCGADGLSIGHCDGGTFRGLQAIKDGLTEAAAPAQPARAGTLPE